MLCIHLFLFWYWNWLLFRMDINRRRKQKRSTSIDIWMLFEISNYWCAKVQFHFLIRINNYKLIGSTHWMNIIWLYQFWNSNSNLKYYRRQLSLEIKLRRKKNQFLLFLILLFIAIWIRWRAVKIYASDTSEYPSKYPSEFDILQKQWNSPSLHSPTRDS